MRKKLSINIIMALLSQVVVTISAFIISHKILGTYGSEANGLLQSVTRFMSFITLLEGGFGGVIKAALYKPLHEKDKECLCELYNSTRSIFTKLGIVVLIYALVIGAFFNELANSSFDKWTCFSLVLVISGATIAEYIVGISYDLILQADQKVYISSLINVVLYIMRLVVMYIVIALKGSLFTLEAAFLVLFLTKIIVLRFIVRSQYNLSLTKKRKNIENRWDGMVQHIAYTIHNNVDVMLITLFISLQAVSVYSVYSMVVTAVNKIIKALSTGTSASIGKIIASGDKERLCVASEKYVYSSSIISISIFAGVSGIILPFVGLYTKDVSDAIYKMPIYAYLIIVAEAVYCLRIPVKTIVEAAGHYRQTRNGSVIETLINLGLSLVLIQFLGIPGVLIATLIAMIYRTIDLTYYLVKHLLNRKTKVVPIMVVNTIIIVFLAFELMITKDVQCHSYFILAVMGGGFGVINLAIVVCVNIVLFGDVLSFRNMIKKQLLRIK